jgi:tetratricopeptide (TPR) repeat protein
MKLSRTALLALPFATLLAVAQGPPVSTGARAHGGNATRLMQERRYSEAAPEFELALAADPENDAVRIAYATCLFAQERNEEARMQFGIEQKRLGETAGIGYYLGLLELRADHFTEAIGKLQPLESDPQFPKASFYLGLAYLGAGRTAAAMESLQRAAKSNPRDPDVHYRLARVYTTGGRAVDAEREYGLYRTARESQRILEEEIPACMDALRKEPLVHAREVCNRIADPTDPRRMILLGQLYSGAGAFSDAVEPLRRAATLEPNSFEAWHYLGVSFFGMRRYADALDPLRKAQKLNPEYFDTVNFLAKTLYSLGDFKAALPVLERAHDLNPEDRQVGAVLEHLRNSLKEKE